MSFVAREERVEEKIRPGKSREVALCPEAYRWAAKERCVTAVV
jgi:hypothetical protein